MSPNDQYEPKDSKELALHIIFEMDFTGEGCDALLEKQA